MTLEIIRPWAHWLRPPAVNLRDTAKALTVAINKSSYGRDHTPRLRAILHKFDSANVMALRDEDLAEYIAQVKIEFPNWPDMVARFL